MVNVIVILMVEPRTMLMCDRAMDAVIKSEVIIYPAGNEPQQA